MSGTAFREAFVKAGYVLSEQSLGTYQAVDPSKMSDADLIKEVEAKKINVADITRQLDDDKAEGLTASVDWRQRAGKARRAIQMVIDGLEAEGRRRGLVAVELNPHIAAQLAREEAKRSAAERHRREQEEDHSRRLETLRAHEEAKENEHRRKLEKIALHDSLHKTRELELAQMFVKAAYRMHSRDVCDRIWKRAKELFPGSVAWRDMPRLGALAKDFDDA